MSEPQDEIALEKPKSEIKQKRVLTERQLEATKLNLEKGRKARAESIITRRIEKDRLKEELKEEKLIARKLAKETAVKVAKKTILEERVTTLRKKNSAKMTAAEQEFFESGSVDEDVYSSTDEHSGVYEDVRETSLYHQKFDPEPIKMPPRQKSPPIKLAPMQKSQFY